MPNKGQRGPLEFPIVGRGAMEVPIIKIIWGYKSMWHTSSGLWSKTMRYKDLSGQLKQHKAK